MIKTAQPRWAKETLKAAMSGNFGKAGKIVKNVRKGITGGSTLNPTHVFSSKYNVKDKRFLPSRMTLGDERRRIAKRKSVKSKALFMKDNMKGQ